MASILTKKLNGRTAAACGRGLNSRAHNSKLYKAIIKLGLNPEEEGTTFEIVIGGRAGRNKNDGYYWAIVKI